MRLRMDIRDNIDNSKAITLKDVADECGVNVGTVSRALRNDGRLCKETVERIKATARELGYDASRHHAARRLAMSRYGHPVVNNILGVFFHHGTFIQSNYFFLVLQGILSAIRWTEFELCTGDQAIVNEKHALPMPYKRGDVDAALFMCQENAARVPVQLLRDEYNFGNRPIVGLVEHMDGCSGVYPEKAAAARQVVEHLLDLGHRCILHFHRAAVEAPGRLDARYTTFREVAAERGFDPDVVLPAMRWDFGSEQNNEQRLRELLRENPDITAITALQDEQAVEIHDMLNKFGYRVPEDISLVGWDDTNPVPDGRGHNILTTVHVPLIEIGYEATRYLMAVVQDPTLEPIERIMPTELVLRGSTAPPKSGSSR